MGHTNKIIHLPHAFSKLTQQSVTNPPHIKNKNKKHTSKHRIVASGIPKKFTGSGGIIARSINTGDSFINPDPDACNPAFGPAGDAVLLIPLIALTSRCFVISND
jgi:hypothetical protein